jgi:hypothetical protein
MRGEAWTTADQRWLTDNAGKYPVSVLASQLGRSKAAVKSRACVLGLSLRYYRRELVWCDQCSKWRTALDANGLCPVCRKKQRFGREGDPERKTFYERQKLSDEASMREQITEEVGLDRQLKTRQKKVERGGKKDSYPKV